MMIDPEVLIHAQGLTKVFHIYDRPIDRLKQAFWNDRQWYREFYALRDVSLDLRKGESLGIIGANGSGKSTLLQILAGTLCPTSGSLEINGKVGALLELGSGFNPEFTGRENVYLSGAILGMSRQQIRDYLPDILDFSEIGEFIDQPVKVYSSGMFLRLAFSVYACLDPEILIIDEALAVGDAGFVHKCLNRIKHLSARGVPFVLVTHDTDAVRSLCTRCLWLDRGSIRLQGEPREVTSRYLQEVFSREKVEGSRIKPRQESEGYVRWGSGGLRVENVRLLNCAGDTIEVVRWGELIEIEVVARAERDWSNPNSGFGIAIRNRNGLDLIAATSYDEGMRLAPWKCDETRIARFKFPAIFASGTYSICACTESRGGAVIDYHDYCEGVLVFKVLSDKPIWSAVLPPIECSIEQNGVAAE